MFKKLFTFAVLPLLAISGFLSAEVEYDIYDIDTLQTHSSEAIALNNQGQLLGWCNVDGSKDGKHFFVRDQDGTFHEVPGAHESGWVIDWQYLTDNGKVYGTFDGSGSFPVLMVWDQQNGLVKLGTLPGKEISAINNVGQVLIKSVTENQDGNSVCRPVIWELGKITRLKGLEGDLGIESEESYGFDMNNNGEVVGQSLISLIYKNNVYYQVHATKWVKGKAIDLHYKIPKTSKSLAFAINDMGDIIIQGDSNCGRFLQKSTGELVAYISGEKITNNNVMFNTQQAIDIEKTLLIILTSLNKTINSDFNSVWLKAKKIITVNDKNEIIVDGETIYGEKHAMLIVPANPD